MKLGQDIYPLNQDTFFTFKSVVSCHRSVFEARARIATRDGCDQPGNKNMLSHAWLPGRQRFGHRSQCDQK
jgi:hypothetical protein